MAILRFSELAQEDLLEIGDGIAEYDPVRALKVLTDWKRSVGDCGHLRSLPCAPYIILYYPPENGVDIARILHSSRDVESLIAGAN